MYYFFSWNWKCFLPMTAISTVAESVETGSNWLESETWTVSRIMSDGILSNRKPFLCLTLISPESLSRTKRLLVLPSTIRNNFTEDSSKSSAFKSNGGSNFCSPSLILKTFFLLDFYFSYLVMYPDIPIATFSHANIFFIFFSTLFCNSSG